jgi:hypothetical protein
MFAQQMAKGTQQKDNQNKPTYPPPPPRSIPLNKIILTTLLAFSLILTLTLALACNDGGGSTKPTPTPTSTGGGGVPAELIGKWALDYNSSFTIEFSSSQFKGTDTGTTWYNCRVTNTKIEYDMGSYGWFTWCESYTLSEGNTKIVFTGGESRPGNYTKQ